jgi:SPP1 gp7 family putative phage head morphogenesis protein
MTRLEALKERIYIECNKLADVEIKQSNSAHINTIKEAYHKAMFDLQKGLDLGFDFSQMPSKTMENILKNPWSGNHFSDRVWKNTEVLATKLTETLTSGMMSGKSVPKMVKEIEDLSEVGKHAANRLIRTETTYMANAAEMESYKEAEIDKYMFVATLDNRTSEICREHDLKVYDVSKAVPGENMPPLHPYCRSTTIAYLGEDTLKDIERRARDPETGKTYKVPAGMNYKEWQKEYVKEV